jgi:hypothetical protein
MRTPPLKKRTGLDILRSPVFVGLVSLVSVAAGCHAAPVEVPATANIFGAGHDAPPEPAGFGAGVLPPMIAVSPGQAVSFTSVTGTVTYSNGAFAAAVSPFGPEGSANFGTTLSSFDGISSITGSGFLWLAGVFLDDSEPADPAPAGLPEFTPAAKSFTTLSPGLRQIFFIGDGQQSGSPQIFIAPPGATRLFLGFADGSGGTGAPGFYGDNAGSLLVTHNVPPPLELLDYEFDFGTNQVELTWTSQAGADYVITHSTTLVEPEWTNLTPVPVLGQAGQTSATVTIPAGTRGFVRVEEAD